MSQLSRPYQIALGAILMLGLVWVVALRGHAANPSEPAPTSAPTSASAPTSTPASSASASAGTSASSAPATSAAAEAKAAGSPTPVYHGAAPGVEGLTRAIAKAHGAVALSQRKAAQFQHEHAADEAPASSSGSTVHKTSVTVTHRSRTGGGSASKRTSSSKSSVQTGAKAHAGRQSQQIAVEHEIAHGKTVMLVFWNPKSTVDATVRSQVTALARGSKGGIAVHVALADQVGQFGSVTEVAHVYQTPTVLIVNRHGVVSTLTGLTDVFALEQAVREAKSASA